MLLNKFTCPQCEAVLQSPAGVQAGKKINCPKCHEPFVVSARGSAKTPPPPEDEEPEEERRRPRRSPTRLGQERARVPGDNGEDDTEAPPRTKKRKKGQRKATPNWLLPALLAGGAVLLLAGGGVVLYLVAFWKQPAAASVPPASGPDVPAGWQEVISAQGGFRAIMPAPVVERSRTMPSPAGSVKDYQYLHETTGADLGYSITYVDFSAAQLQQVSLEQIIDAGRDGVAKSSNGQVEVDRRIEREGRHGRELVIGVPGRGRFLMHYYIAGSRLYTLTVAGAAAALDAKEPRAFFDSFHFTDAKR